MRHLFFLIPQFVEEAAVFIRERRLGEKVGAIAKGFFEGPLTAPAANGLVAAAGEDGGDRVAEEVCGTGVVGVIEKAA